MPSIVNGEKLGPVLSIAHDIGLLIIEVTQSPNFRFVCWTLAGPVCVTRFIGSNIHPY